MGWETRGDRRYFYKSERIGVRVVKRYVGPGEVAELFDAINEDKKAARIANNARVRAAVEEVARLEAMIAPLEEIARDAADKAMQAAGYHRINRGPWRKRRVQIEGTHQADTSDPAGG